MGKKDLFIYLSDVRFLFKAILQFSHLSEATIKELAQPFSPFFCGSEALGVNNVISPISVPHILLSS